MVKKLVPCTTADTAHSFAIVGVKIRAAERVPTFTRWFGSLHCGMDSDGFFLRFCVVVLALLGKNPFNRPSLFNPIPKSASINPAFLLKLENMICLSPDSNHSFCARITRLFCFGCPFAIRWFIVTIRVLAFKCESIGAITHISKEGLKRIAPFVANRDAPASINGKASRSGVVASSLHVPPRLIKHFSGLHAIQYLPNLSGGQP